MVVRLLAGGLGYKGLEAAIKAIWKPKGDYTIMDLENNYFAIQFARESNYLLALLDGPWVVRGTYLTVQPWTPSFSSRKVKISTLAAWVRLPGLPFHYYHKSLIRAIGNLIGTVLRIDYNTSLTGRGQFARMAVELDGSKPILSGIEIEGHFQKIEYEGLPSVCYRCGLIRHLVEKCLKALEMQVLEKVPPNNSTDKTKSAATSSSSAVEKEVIRVEVRKLDSTIHAPRRQYRKTRKDNANKGQISKSSGSEKGKNIENHSGS